MGPEMALPFQADFPDVETYVESLLSFGTSSSILRTLCGGVHILDFFTRTPDLYSRIVPQSWRQWFRSREIADILHLLLREDLQKFDTPCSPALDSKSVEWREGSLPPSDLIEYVKDVRRHLLDRNFRAPDSDHGANGITRNISIGMKPKKLHEVSNFARYLDKLTANVAAYRGQPITHLIDFGSGQNYLGRTLACQPYSKHIVAVENRPHNVEEAKKMDVRAKLAKKPITKINKKLYRAQVAAKVPQSTANTEDQPSPNTNFTKVNGAAQICMPCSDEQGSISGSTGTSTPTEVPASTQLEKFENGLGTIQYIHHRITCGDLSPILPLVLPVSPSSQPNPSKPNLSNAVASSASDLSCMVMSIHSCGNLSHHGLRTLVQTPNVHAVAIIGCCYNLLTERLGPPTYKHPQLREPHARVDACSNARDPHGFPMSERFLTYPIPPSPGLETESKDFEQEHGIRWNITARMMAVQAPQNWGPQDSESFFTRHFYRALLQRIFMDRDIVQPPSAMADGGCSPAGTGVSSNDEGKQPIVIGGLAKRCYRDFVSYVRGTIAKMTSPGAPDPEGQGAWIASMMEGMTDEDIRDYEERYKERKKELSIVWSLMAFSAGIVESMIVVDRWCWLKEQEEVAEAWVESVFEYGLSPRNLVVVGVKK